MKKRTILESLLVGEIPESLLVPNDERIKRLLDDAGQRRTDRTDSPDVPRDRMG